MEESHSLLLNEEALKACPDAKKAVFVYEWLRYLDRILPTIQKADLRSMQGKLIAQLETRLAAGGGPPTRQLIASCIAKVFAVGDSSALFTIINQCNDSLKAKDESAHQLHIKLTAVCCLGALYENVGRLVGRSYEETFQLCTKWFKTAESQGRTEMMCMLTRMARGLGNGGQSVHKEMHKLARTAATDRAMPVRVAALQCLAALVKEYPPLYTTELEATITLCVKSLEGSSYEARRAVAGLISALLSAAHTPPQQVHHSKPGAAPIPIRALPVDECLQLLANAFLRGGIGGFLKGATSSGAAAAGGSREVRVGITMGYVAWISCEGVLWLERNVSVVCAHLCQLASKTGVLGYTNVPAQQQEVILLRQCISYIFRSSIGRILGEGAQLSACKALGGILAEAINAFDYSLEPSSERELGPDVHACGQLVAVAVLEMSALVRQIGTAVTPLFVEASGIMEPVFACLLHPLLPARAATAWCLRCVAFAVPSQLTPLIDRCLSRLEHMRGSADAVSGYSLALSALIAGSADCRLGIPHAKPRQVLCVAEELLRTAAQSPRVAVAKMNAGWLLLHALAQLGPTVTREMLPKVLLLWRAAFPRSAKEAEAEKNRGDAFTWQCALESRAGALAVMCAVCAQTEMQTEEVIKAVLLPAECSLVAMSQVGALIRSFGSPIRRLIAMVRVRVYALLALLPPKTYESVYASLLRELVADVTLSDNSQSTQSTTLASSMCRGPERTLAEPWADECDERVLEAQMCALQPGGTAAALENDTTCLVTGSTACLDSCWPQPLQPPAQCVDAAVVLYGRVFPLVPAKHKLQITDHFAEVIKNNAKNVQRQHAIQLNSVCAVAHALKAIGEQKSLRLDGEALHKSTSSLIVLALMSPLPMTRCVAAEALGRLAHAAADPQFVVALAATAFERLKSAREVPARQGWALSLGCLHRHCGSLGSGQHLNTAVSLVLALAQDPSAPAVQAWSLVALAQMAETGGGQFRAYVEPVLAVCLRLLLTTGSGGVEVVQCAGKVLSALMTCVGPELAAGGAGAQAGIRQGLLAACALQMAHPDALVVCEALAGLQQMHLFAPRHVQMDALVAWIAGAMSSPHVCLRRAAVSCLRQLSQREAREVREHAEALVPHGVVEESKCLPLPDTGLEGALFAMLDVETEPTLIAHIQETLISLVQATCGDLLAVWLALCKEILAASSGENARSTMIVDDKGRKAEEGEGEEDEEDGGDDDCTLRGAMSGKVDKGKPSPRWQTRVFAAQLVRRLMQVCDTERAHLDLALAKELQMSSGGRADYLVLHLSDLVRMSFMAATSDNTELRLEGLKSLQDVITRFSAVPEPEFPGHVILEQFQAQVGAALRPAFAEETPSHVTAAACQVCSTWIGSGVARDLNDLRRVHQLLVSSLSKLRHGSINTQLYSESAATLEQLSILKAWAEVYATAVQQQEAAEKEKAAGGGERSEDDGLLAGGGGGGGDTLLALVKPELHSLAAHWLAALRDAALLALPGEFEGQLPKKGAFWQGESVETCRGYFRGAWPSMLLAAAIWLQHNSFQLPDEREGEPSPWPTNSRESRLRVLIGLAVEALSARSGYSDDLTIQTCVRALCRLLATDWCAVQLMREPAVAIEIVHVLHRLILTRDSLLTQQLCCECAGGVLAAAVGAVELGGQRGDMENGNACIGSEQIDQNTIEQLYRGEENVMCAEGGEPRPQPGSLSFALLELHLCLLVRQMPQINSSSMRRQLAPLHLRRLGRLPPESAHLVRSAVAQLVQLPKLCSPDGAVRILPVLLYLLMGLLRESARVDELQQQQPPLPAGHLSPTATAALQALRQLCSSVPSDKTHQLWVQHLRNAMHTLLQLPAAEPPVDACVVQLACVVMAAAAPAAVSLSHRPTQRALAHLVKRGLASTEKTVVSKTLQSVTSLFSRRDICAPFVKELAPCVFDVLRPLVSGEEAPERAKHVSLEEVQVVADAIRAMEAVIAQAKEEKKRLSLVSLLAQSVCRLLLAFDAEQWRLLSPAARKLHETALARLNALAPAYPAEFRLVVSCHPELKRRVEAALLFQSTRQQTTLNANKLKQSRETAKPTTAQPTIKLTMDFNAFGKAAE